MYEKEFEKIFSIAKQKKIDDIEIYLSANKSFSVKIFQQEVESFDYSDGLGLGVRVLQNGHIGYAFTEKMSDDAFEMIIKSALENAKYVDNPDKIMFANYAEIEQKIQTYYPEWEDIKVEDKIDKAKLLEKSAREFDNKIINVPHSSFGDFVSKIKVANSQGLDREYITNRGYAFVMTLAKKETEIKSGRAYKISHSFEDIKADKIGMESAERAVNLLGAKEVKPGKYPIVFNNKMASTLLDTFANIFSAKAVQENYSLLKGKLGEKIANEKVNIIDNALLKHGFSTRPFDDEGYPSQMTKLVTNGTLTSFLHNTITANKDNTSSTGNASRSYKGTLTVSHTNFYLEKCDKTREQILNIPNNCIEIVELQGMHSGCNPVSGDFSLSAQGFFYQNGKLKYPVHNFTISGNFLQLLNDIAAIGNDLEFNFNAVGSPCILISALSVSG